MAESATHCATCPAQVTDDAQLCTGPQSCTEHLAHDLAEIPALARSAADAYAGQAHTTRLPGGRDPDPDPDADREQTAKIQALPWDEPTSTAVRRLRNELVTTVRLVVEERRYPAQRTAGPACVLCTHPSCRATRVPGWPADTLPAMALWLLRELPWLRRHPAAGELHRDIGRAVGRLRATVDRAPDLVYAGPCPTEVRDDGTARQCGADLYAAPDAETVTCPACRSEHDVAGQRAAMRRALSEYLLTAVQIARALTSPSQVVRDDRIRQWASRGRLMAHGKDPAGHPLYRVGDVEALLAEDERRAAAKQARRGRIAS